jgi:DNA-binding PadR family transcriptional regulator
MEPVSVGDLELTALLAVVRLGAGAYGASIRRDLSERSRHDYAIGTIYTTLQRLEDKKLVVSTMSEPTAVRGGRAKRCFRVTAAGDAVLRRARRVTAAMWQGVPGRLKTV